jgi:hypothetical protein
LLERLLDRQASIVEINVLPAQSQHLATPQTGCQTERGNQVERLATNVASTALAVLREDTQAWWADVLARDPDEMEEGEESATADAESLRRFLEGEVLPWFENRKKELANRPLIREQAFGEALDPDKLERLGRYEVHLDRKLERMLTILLRLKELRRAAVEG